mgnify:CR=1 FL=1
MFLDVLRIGILNLQSTHPTVDPNTMHINRMVLPKENIAMLLK